MGPKPLRQGIQESLDKILKELAEAEQWVDDSQQYEMDGRSSMFLAVAKQHIETVAAELKVFAQVASDELNDRDERADNLQAELDSLEHIRQELEI